MPERPDLRQIAGDIREALADYDRETLADILTHVFKEYVVESPPPMLVHQTEQIEELAGLSFAELIETLQNRLDVPELAQFQVQGSTVEVRVGGVWTPLGDDGGRAPGRRRDPAAPQVSPVPSAPEPAPAAQSDRGPRAAAREAATRGRMDGHRVVEAPPPRPGGLRVSGRATPSPGSGAPGPRLPGPAEPEQPRAAPQPPPESPPQPAATADSEPAPRKDGETGDDDASIRFSLLELD